MNKFLKSCSGYLLTLALGAVSVLVFVATISPYKKAEEQLRRVEPQLKAAVAAERFDRFSALEIKEVEDLSLLPEKTNDRKTELEGHASQIGHFRQEAFAALETVRQDERATVPADTRDDNLLINHIRRDHASLQPVENRIREATEHITTNGPASQLVEDQFLPIAVRILANADLLSQRREAELGAGTARLGGELEGVMLYSGPELRLRSREIMEGAAQAVATRAFARLFIGLLINGCEFLYGVAGRCVGHWSRSPGLYGLPDRPGTGNAGRCQCLRPLHFRGLRFLVIAASFL